MVLSEICKIKIINKGYMVYTQVKYYTLYFERVAGCVMRVNMKEVTFTERLNIFFPKHIK